MQLPRHLSSCSTLASTILPRCQKVCLFTLQPVWQLQMSSA